MCKHIYCIANPTTECKLSRADVNKIVKFRSIADSAAELCYEI